jgi:hypothetical protein
MFWLGLAVGIINISRGDKFFFHFFANLFERPQGGICLCLVRCARSLAREWYRLPLDTKPPSPQEVFELTSFIPHCGGARIAESWRSGILI